MGVTNRNEQTYKHTISKSNVTSTESLYLTSDGETSVSNGGQESIDRPVTLRRRRKVCLPLPTSIIFNKKSAGRRRLRRMMCVDELEALKEEDECDSADDLIPNHCSSFTTLLQDPELEKAWDNFVLSDEATQNKLLQTSRKKPTKVVSGKERNALHAYQGISTSTRSVLKRINNIYELQQLETKILEHFTNSPGEIFMKIDMSSYQRLLIHGVAQFYRLKSKSLDDDGNRVIQVTNPANSIIHCSSTLAVYIQNNRKH